MGCGEVSNEDKAKRDHLLRGTDHLTIRENNWQTQRVQWGAGSLVPGAYCRDIWNWVPAFGVLDGGHFFMCSALLLG
jgi:hypothetical protein